MKHHATFSPSSLPALNACPCYVGGNTSEAADKGRLLHDFLESLLKARPWDIEKAITSGQVSRHDIDGIYWAYDFIMAIARDTQNEIGVERMVHILGEDFQEITFGTVDADMPGILIDLKTGQERDYKPQMAAYALGKMQEDGSELVHIIELYSKNRHPVEYDLSLEEAEKIVYGIKKKADDPNKTPTPCDYCAWCAKKIECQAANDCAVKIIEQRPDLLDGLDVSFHSSETVKDALSILSALDCGAELTDEIAGQLAEHGDTLSYLLNLSKAVGGWADAVKHQVTEAVKGGVAVPGFKLQSRDGRKKITNVQEAFNLCGLPAEKFMSICDVSLTKLAELFEPEEIQAALDEAGKELPEYAKKKRGDGMLKSKIKPVLNFLLEEIVEQNKTTYSVVKERI